MTPEYRATVNRDICASCGACARECPKSAITVWKGCFAVVDQNQCVGCGKCSKVCPTGCIALKKREDEPS